MFRQRTGRHWVGALLTSLIAAMLLVRLFPGEVRHPSAYLYGTGGDAIKNYFVLAYYDRYDTGHRFTGMNYPRGEHVNFPDMQPLLSMPLAWARQAGLSSAPEAGIALTNIGLLLALVITAGVLYALLRRQLLPAWYAGLVALCITLMAPQIDRFQGHMALGYACFVPIQWYCLTRILEAPRRWAWQVGLGVFNLLTGLLATYHLGIGSLWLLAYVPVLAWQQGWQRSRPVLIRLVATAMVPMLTFWVWLKLTDPITDRPTDPWGLLVARANFSSIFSPNAEPLRSVWAYVFHTEPPIFEGASYVSFVGFLVLVFSGWLALRYVVRRQWRRIARPVLPSALRAGVWAATILLLFSMAFPFIVPGLNGWTWLLGPLKQFRALGRFSWPFYYVFSVYTAFYLYRLWRYLRQRRAPGFATAWLLPLLALWAAEATWHITTVAAAIEPRQATEAFMGEEGNYRQLLGWTSWRPDSFQAILPLPYYSVGTDKLDFQGTNESHYESFKAALNLHLPLLTTFMSRSSISETLRMTQLLGGPLVTKELLPKLPSQKPILLLVTPQTLTPAEQRLVSLAHKIASSPSVTLYELPIAALAATDLVAEQAKAARLLPAQPTNGLYTTTNKGVMRLAFDQSADRRGRLAPGAFAAPGSGFSTIYDGPLPMPADTGRYEVSVWVSATTSRGLGNLQVKLYGPSGQLVHATADTRASAEIVGTWVRVAVTFHRPAEANRLEILYENDDLLADDLLVRPLDTNVYWHDARGQLVLNGYPLVP